MFSDLSTLWLRVLPALEALCILQNPVISASAIALLTAVSGIAMCGPDVVHVTM